MGRSSRRARRSRGPCSWSGLAASTSTAEPASAPAPKSYAGGARILSIGIAATGLFTFAYFAVAGHVLSTGDYGRVSLLWSLLFVIMSVIYRPVEQLLSRTIADRRGGGITARDPPRGPALIQGGFAAGFLLVGLALRGAHGGGAFVRDPSRYRDSIR